MPRVLMGLWIMASCLTAGAQTFLERCELGVTGGGMNYIGDLNDQSMFGQVGGAAGLVARFNFDTRWSLALGGGYGRIGADNDVLKIRNLSFRSSVIEGYLRAEFNFLPYGLKKGVQKSFTPFIFGGIGFFHFNPQAQYKGTWYDLQPLGTEGQGTSAFPTRSKYALTQLCMPFGLGIRWRISSVVHLTAEYGWRKTWCDYLDDVSTTYVGSDLLRNENGETAAVLADRSGEVREGYTNAVGVKRGDDSLDDWYAYFNVSVSFSMEMLFGWMRGKRCER